MNVRLRRWILFLGWLLFTFYLCQQDGAGSAALSRSLAEKLIDLLKDVIVVVDPIRFQYILRKIAHVFVHLVLAFLCYRAIRTTATKTGISIFLSLVVSIAFAIVDEAVQLISTFREPKTRP